MLYPCTLSFLFITCSLFSASTPTDQYIAHKQRDTFGGAILPCATIQGEPYFLLGKESYKEGDVYVWSDFGGSNQPFDINPEHVAFREFAQETAGMFCDDKLFDPHKTAKSEVITNIKKHKESLRVHPYTERKLKDNKRVYCAVAKVMYELPKDIQARVRSASEEKYKEMTNFMWVKADEFLDAVAQAYPKVKMKPGSSYEIIVPSITVTDDLKHQHKIIIRALFFRRLRPESHPKIKAIIDEYARRPY